MAHRFARWAERCPKTAASVALGTKYFIADVAVQAASVASTMDTREARRTEAGLVGNGEGYRSYVGKGWRQILSTVVNEIDPYRSLSFLVFGFLYGGPINYRVFALYERVVRQFTAGVVSVVRGHIRRRVLEGGIMTALDVGVHLPFVFMPAFYITQSAILTGPANSIDDGISKWQDNFRTDLRNICVIWTPINMAMFIYVPLALRTPFISVVGMTFPVVLSIFRGSGQAAAGDGGRKKELEVERGGDAITVSFIAEKK